MKNWKIMTLAGLLALVSVPLLAGQTGDRYGAGVTLSDNTPIASILADPNAYMGKTLRVEGVVSSLCEKSGCWMQLADTSTNEGLRIAFDEGKISIPLTARGRKAVAEGVFGLNPAGIPNTPEAEHEANCPYHQKNLQKYQILATGALVLP
jgi:hypothetical protein